VFVKSAPADKQQDKFFLYLNDTLLVKGEKCLLSIPWKFRFYNYNPSDTIYSQN
jgi:hypothetical protein